jgi:hypothetical protein
MLSLHRRPGQPIVFGGGVSGLVFRGLIDEGSFSKNEVTLALHIGLTADVQTAATAIPANPRLLNSG